MVETTTVVETATLTTFAEFLTNWVSAETTPYRLRSTTLRMLLLLGELKIPLPVLCIIMVAMTSQTGDRSWSANARTKAPAAVNAMPHTVGTRHPKRSATRPLNGPISTMHTAGGIIINPTCSGEYCSTRCK